MSVFVPVSVFLFLYLAAPTMPTKIFGEIPPNLLMRIPVLCFLSGNVFAKMPACFFVIFYFGIYENTCDIGNFEFTHFPSQLQNVNPTANLMKIKHSFSLNPTFFVF